MTKEASHLFLLEIGCEELPHWAIAPALNHLRKEFAALAVRERLNEPIYEPEDLLGTPRRLASGQAGPSGSAPGSCDSRPSGTRSTP